MSYKVIIADDEPLVLIGLESLLNWESEGFEIVAAARNGQLLEEAIANFSPDLVISDIKMPVKNGLEVLEKLRAGGQSLPVFIFLTAYEEFELIKKAISLDAVDYIVKLELDKKQLLSALERARRRIAEIKGAGNISPLTNKRLLQDRFFMRQLFALEDPGEREKVDINLDYPAFSVAYVTIPSLREMENEKAVSLFTSAVRLLEETLSRYSPSFTVPLSLGYAAVIFPLTEEQKASYHSALLSPLKASLESLKNFFSLDASVAVGGAVTDLKQLSESFMAAKLLSEKEEFGAGRVTFADYKENEGKMLYDEIRFDTDKTVRAFSEFNASSLDEEIESIISQINTSHISKARAMDAASSLLHMAENLIPGCEDSLNEIFPKSENIFGYRALYQARSNADIVNWLKQFKAGMDELFERKHSDYRLQTIKKIQLYINDNVSRRLTLGEVSSLFGYSQSYLSSLFTRYAKINFVDYVNNAKIERAKVLLSDPNAMVYEVATNLGFESPFYFSKVFKKVTGVSPTTWQKSLKEKREE